MTANEDAYQAIKRTQEALSLPDSDTELVIPKRTKEDQKDLDTYERMMRNMMQDHPLTDRGRQELNDIRELLHLREEDVREIEERLTAQQATQVSPRSDSSNALTTPPTSGIHHPPPEI
ncbi:MAG: hypothetical protein HC866_16180, partial [Leptolyngbyaceae cyanobacterium RU_5_1]|nr:hypothetical protein [Leptolyngbyaceae cyanobacterium RU_5_1]